MAEKKKTRINDILPHVILVFVLFSTVLIALDIADNLATIDGDKVTQTAVSGPGEINEVPTPTGPTPTPEPIIDA